MACSGRNGIGTGSQDMYEKYTLPKEREQTIRELRNERWRLHNENERLRKQLKRIANTNT